MSRRVFLVAGEHSGDRLGAGLARALRRAEPGIRLEGMGGREMEEAGVELLVDSSRLGVTGIVEVLRHLGTFRRVFATLCRRFDEDPPDVVVPIDYPDFNLRLAREAKARGIPVVYFVSPQVWAWRRRRVRQIARRVRRMLVLFPFEEEFYRSHRIPVTFVGHPMVGRLESVPGREESRRNLGLPPEEPVVALLPGSRANEVERILPVLVEAAGLLYERVEGVHFVLPIAPGVDRSLYERLAEGPVPIVGFSRGYEELVRAADVAAVASGTATLETALLGTPLVAVYRLNPLTYLLGRSLVRLDHVAMPNLIAGRRAVPELVQGELQAEPLARELEELLEGPRRERMLADLAEIRRELSGPEPFSTAAEAVLAEA